MYLRSEETAVRASQYLTLSSGGYDAAWYATLSGIRNLRQLVHNSLTRQGRRFEEPLAGIEDDIYLTRRVFTKVRPIKFCQLSSADRSNSRLDRKHQTVC